MTTAFVFPGQGSQAVGMGQGLIEAFPVARAVFEEVDEALKLKLSAIIKDGPEAELTRTENAQPAIMAVSLAGVSGDAERDGREAARLGVLRRRALAGGNIRR